MSVHYKFKSSLDFDTITFDGLHISVNDFRKAVIQQKRLGKTNDFELQITNAQTKEEYEHDNDLIPKNTSLIISRIPQTSKKPTRDSQNQNTLNICHVPKFDGNTLDLSQMNASEEDKIQAMMAQSTVDYDPRGYQKIRGPGQTGEVPPTYRCYKCHQTGHWIKNCPLPHSTTKKSEIRRNTGIPKSFLQEKDSEKELAAEEIVVVEKQAEVPDELLCSICKDIFRDAVMIPCCGSSFCDDCVRTALLESEENECPDCKEKGTSPGSLIPNRFLRSSVNTFKNETGYERKRKNNGIHEVAANSTVNIPEILSDKESNKEIKMDTPEKCSSVESVAAKELEPDSTPPKLSPEREDSIPLKMEDIDPIKSEEKLERQRKPSVEPISPKHRVEVVVPQRDISHNLDAQARSEDTFKQINPSTFSNYGPTVPDIQHRSNNTDSYSVRSDSFMRHTKHGQSVVQPPHMGYCNNYGNRTERYYYPRDSYNVNAAPYPFLPNTRCRQMTPHSNIQPYYQGMSGTMETGTIEDPLEAFNRIMKEKEKRKEMKRLASERHRSSVVKRGPRDPSPIMEKRRHRASPVNERRNRSPLRQEKLSSHRIIERDKNIRSHRSHYSNSKRSFSRSNSPPQRRYSKSPRRRSRSRSHPRSHSREIDLLRNDNRPTKHVLQQSHRADYDKDVLRYSKKSSGRFSETRSFSELGPKENRRHSSKIRENGNQNFDNYTGSRKTFIETDNVQESRDFKYEFHEKKNKIPLNKVEDVLKMDKKSRDNEERHIVHTEDVHSKQETEKKSKERKKKKEKDEKVEKKSKRDKKEKKKRERHKDEQKKHSEHKKPRKEPDLTSNENFKESEERRNENRICRKDNFKSSNEESLDDRNETFTPDININRNLEMDHLIDDMQEKEGNPRLSEENTISNVEKSPIIYKNERFKQNMDNNCSELNTPTSFVDTTPENYAGKWDNFDFSIPNSEDIRGENGRDGEYNSHEFQNLSPMKNDQFESSKNYNKNNDSITWLHQFEDRQPKNENVVVEKRKDKRSELPTKSASRKSSPTPSEAMSSSSNTSNVGKTSQSKKRRKKSKHKKDKQYHKRSSSAESSKNSRKSASNKHKKSRSEKKKKTKRNESR